VKCYIVLVQKVGSNRLHIKIVRLHFPHSYVLISTHVHLTPIPMTWLIALQLPRESHGIHGTAVFSIPTHISSPYRKKTDGQTDGQAARPVMQPITANSYLRRNSTQLNCRDCGRQRNDVISSVTSQTTRCLLAWLSSWAESIFVSLPCPMNERRRLH